VCVANAVSRRRDAMRPNDAETFAPKSKRAQGDLQKKAQGNAGCPLHP
jgi:hypothetical protein